MRCASWADTFRQERCLVKKNLLRWSFRNILNVLIIRRSKTKHHIDVKCIWRGTWEPSLKFQSKYWSNTSFAFFFLSSSFFFLLSGIRSSNQLSSLFVKQKSRSFRTNTRARTYRRWIQELSKKKKKCNNGWWAVQSKWRLTKNPHFKMQSTVRACRDRIQFCAAFWGNSAINLVKLGVLNPVAESRV